MKGWLCVGGLSLAILILAGCGSSSGSGGWKVDGKTDSATTNYTSNASYVATVANPTAIELKFEGTPNFTVKATASILCDQNQSTLTSATFTVTTPATKQLVLPTGSRTSCQVYGSAPLPMNQALVVTVLSK